MLRKIRRPSPAMVVACIALGIALGGASYAATVLPRNSVGPAQLRNNSVNSLKVANRSLRTIDFARGQLPRGAQGPAGPEGPAGPAGPKGDKGDKGDPGGAATGLWASVDSNGTLVRNKGASSAQKNGTGDYQVVFGQDVRECSYQATIGGPTTGTTNGQISAGQLNAVNAGVRVRTFSSTGAAADRNFFVAVFC